MKRASRVLTPMFILFAIEFSNFTIAQDYGDDDSTPPAPPPAQDNCNGIFVSYDFISRHKIYPLLKNAEKQAWAFNSTATIINTGSYELKAWKIYVGFQHKEILVAANGGVLVNGEDFPAEVGTNGTYFSGSQQTDLKTSISTGGDFTQIQAIIQISGTQFGVKPSVTPMPKTIRLVNDGFKCPSPTKKKTSMTVCCVRNPKSKVATKAIKFLPRQKGDLSLSYDVIQAYGNNYLAQVTIESTSPLARLDHWNISWEWMRGEFIQTMKGAYTHKMDYLPCIYGAPGQYYQDMDFSKVMNCEKNPTIADLPRERSNDSEVGRIPYCCRNGSLLSPVMNKTQAKSVFQMQVFKLPPDLDRKTLYPPEKWKVSGVVSAEYKCGQPIRVDPTEFPDPSGLQASTLAIASWQVICNITRPQSKKNKCCVSFSSYYNESVIPCNTCACGCPDTKKCNPSARAMFLPPEALLVPFKNRSALAAAWAKIKHFHIPKPQPCGDNCGVSINWHVLSDYTDGWTARITLFNWMPINFEDWFAAVEMKKGGGRGYENAYSMNGTKLANMNNIIFLQGLKGLNFLVMQTNGTKKDSPAVPGKQQSVISFKKARTPGIQVAQGDGFPAKVYFNGEECALPTSFPSYGNRNHVNLIVVIFLSLLTFAM
ncbi:hypothetical protein ACLB2K_024341 [Fragaria x ananassa]